jgi:hypothetical protein
MSTSRCHYLWASVIVDYIEIGYCEAYVLTDSRHIGRQAEDKDRHKLHLQTKSMDLVV